MNYIYPSVGIILAFAWCIFLLNAQRDEIRHWKHQAQIAVSHHNAKNHELRECNDGLEGIIKTLEESR